MIVQERAWTGSRRASSLPSLPCLHANAFRLRLHKNKLRLKLSNVACLMKVDSDADERHERDGPFRKKLTMRRVGNAEGVETTSVGPARRA